MILTQEVNLETQTPPFQTHELSSPTLMMLSNRPPYSGIGVYVQMLQSCLAQLDVSTESRHWNGPATDRIYRFLREHVKIPDGANPLLYIEEAFRVLGQARHFWATPSGFDLYHVTNAALAHIVNRRSPAVVTVHDMIPFLNPRFLTDRLIRSSIKSISKADKVICVSETVRKEVLELTAVEESRVRVVMNGVDHGRFRERDKTESRRRLGLPLDSTIVLHVGSEEPRKGVPILFQAFKAVMNSIPNPLLLRVGEHTPASQQIIAELQIGANVRYIHGLSHEVDQQSIGYVYNAADVLCFPSTYEPFGLPPLEAMASGCPVVASNASAIPEVVGDSGILVDARDVRAYSEALTRVLTDQSVATYYSMRGLERAAHFSWERCARETLAVYQEVVPNFGI